MLGGEVVGCVGVDVFVCGGGNDCWGGGCEEGVGVGGEGLLG